MSPDRTDSPPNPALQLPSACPARARRLRGLLPQGGFGLESQTVIRTTNTIALAAERQGRYAS
jgi:hypothetical protein